jgi:type I restriction enzyme R subunit
LPLEVLEAVDVESLKIQKQGTYEIKLENQDGVMEPMGSGGYNPSQLTEEIDPLSVIIHEINERYGTNFDDDDKVILNNLSQKMLQNKVLQGAILNNEASAAKIKFDEVFDQELISMLNSHFELYKKLDERPELKKFANEKLFEYLLKKVA